ncbi:MAG: ATP-binding protein [Oscillospiraceae bacterium]|jgi:DNA replication protein DnaC
MGYDGKILKRALKQRKARREQREEERLRLRQEIYRRVPRLEEIDRQLRQTMLQVMQQALSTGGDPEAEMEKIRRENQALQEEQRQLLRRSGYPADALDDVPFCRACNDTGYCGAAPCACLKELYAKEQIKELSKLLQLGEQSFDTFSLDVYDAQKWPGKGISPRENMELIYEICLGYARKFEKYYFNNLFLSGGTGLGKTFLSACIAKEVSGQGFSVVYDTATQILAQFEAQKFSRDQEGQEGAEEVRRYLRCDLLIVDDLGSELTTPFVQSALYTLINSRLGGKHHTVISSNLSLQELKNRYSAPIYSRIAGEYRMLSFFGEDIRLQTGQGPG